MEKCPIKPKTSDLDPPAERKASGRPNYLSPAQLAQLLGPLKQRPGRRPRCCSERTVREWCKRGLIPEAYQTPGGHWRIGMPLSMKTRHELEKRAPDSPWYRKIRKLEEVFAPEIVEMLMLARIYGVDVHDKVPVPYLAELEDRPHQEELTENAINGKERAARQIQDLISQRLEAGKSLSDLFLIGSVYKFWLDNKRRPTVAEIADLMKMSRQAFYRRYSTQELNEAYFTVTGESKRDLPDPDGLDPVQRANRNARKPSFASLQRDYNPHNRFI